MGSSCLPAQGHPTAVPFIFASFGIGEDDLVFIETFRSDHYEEVSLANWLAHLPPKLVTAHLNIPGDTLAKFPKGAQGIVPLA
jgi:oxalate decarboxylase/phosphoglucose isomerase-like protein (cupin superfamily)